MLLLNSFMCGLSAVDTHNSSPPVVILNLFQDPAPLLLALAVILFILYILVDSLLLLLFSDVFRFYPR